MRKLIILISFTFVSLGLMSQNLNVRGVVTDSLTGETLLGVNVIVKNSSKGDVTDFDGNYKISSVPKGSILVFSYLGYKTIEVAVDKEVINVALEESSEKLDEIVVVGYGTQRKKEVTGAVSVLGSETIERLKPTRIEQAIQGQVAGVNITSSSGAPGAGLNIRIRGVSTNGDSRPLILLDGSVIEDLSVVNPSDVESINILKDATAGIYGVRAANGVILITTKSGRKETDFKYNLNIYTGIQTTTRKIPLLNATEYALLANEAFAANGDPIPFANVNSIGLGTNWQDEVFKTAPIREVNFSFTKGTEKSTYGASISGFDQRGIVGLEKSRFNRRTVKFDFNTDILENLKLTTSTFYFNTNRFSLAESGLGSVLFNALNMPANLLPTDQAPTTGVGIEVINPLDQVENTHNRTWVNKISGNYALNYKFLDYFSAQSGIQFNHAMENTEFYFPKVDYGSAKVFNILEPVLDKSRSQFTDYTFDAFIKYERIFNEDHDVKVLLGTSVFQTTRINELNTRYLSNTATHLRDATRLRVIRNNLVEGRIPRLGYDVRLQSFFTRVQYNYKGKYIFSGVLRRDGSSVFGPENRFGYFPSASIGWLASEESFTENLDFLDLLKVRASYGVIGNDRIAANRFLSLLDGEGAYVFGNTIFTGLAIGPVANPEIRWEKQKPFDVGIDIGIFNKIDITADYYYKKTEDLLVNPETSQLLGVTAPGSLLPLVNAGDVENQGFEFSISYKDKIGEDFNFNVNYNLATLQNKVLFVGSDTGVLFAGSFGVGQENDISRMEEGFPIGYFYGLQTDGLFQTQSEVNSSSQPNAAPGDIRFIDRNQDGVIDDNDRTNIGDPIPTLTMGLSFSFDYKQFDFSAYAFASFGNEIVRNYERTTPLTNRTVYDLDRWTGPGTSNTVPRVTTGATTNTLFSDYYLESGDFIRIQNVQFGYSLSDNALSSSGFDKFRIYLSGNNLFTFTKYRGFDPSATSGNPIGGGIDQGFYPVPRAILLGLNVQF